MKIIPYGRQYIDSRDIRLVSKSLKEDLITTGRYVKEFENKISKFLKVKYAVSCSSGTSALHLALMAINIKKNDVIIMPAINFIAVYSMSKFMGAKIFLADVDPLTGQMTPSALLKCIKDNKINKIKAIITMYLGGHPENIIDFYKLKKKFNCYLIEDACHALGAKYFYKKTYLHIGSCKHSDLTTFSLHPVKTITTGEGGFVTTNNCLLNERLREFRSHGIVRNNKAKHWIYDINKLGFNYRLSDINCALGLSQLKKINKFINFRKSIYSYYRNKLKKISNHITIPKYNSHNKSSFHLFLISVNFSKIKSIKDELFTFLKKNNIYAQYHYIPIYKFSVFDKKDFSLPNAEYYFNYSISLPIFFNHNRKQQDYVLSKINNFVKKKQ
jgi:dTDP-4-amino-4,6-dideoxygalactose transaminase